MSSLRFAPAEILILETGASHAPAFSRKTTHLLCPSRQGPKAEKALEWGIPVIDITWLEDLLLSVADSFVTENEISSLAPPNKDDGGFVEPEPSPAPESVPRGMVFRSSFLLPLTRTVETANTDNPRRIESNPKGTFPPADNSILPEFEFRTDNFLGHSTLKKDRLLKPEPTLNGDAESNSLQLPSAVTHIEEWEPVPSSRSPSPMVLKKSPSKEEEREQRAHQVIAESITTLLGKRQASKEEVVVAVQNGRQPKRPRPLSRAKVGGSSLIFRGEIHAFTVVE